MCTVIRHKSVYPAIVISLSPIQLNITVCIYRKNDSKIEKNKKEKINVKMSEKI